MTIAITVGHRQSSQGARNTDGVTEWTGNAPICQAIAEHLTSWGHIADVLYRPDSPDGMVLLVAQLNRRGYDVAVELHFNSFSSAAATGSEVLYHHASQDGLLLALSVQTRMVDALGLPDRGVKRIYDRERGWSYLSGTSMPAIIVEPYFGSNPGDTARATERSAELAQAIAQGIADYMETV